MFGSALTDCGYLQLGNHNSQYLVMEKISHQKSLADVRENTVGQKMTTNRSVDQNVLF